MSDNFYFILEPAGFEEINNIRSGKVNLGQLPKPGPDSMILPVFATDHLKQHVPKREFLDVCSTGLLLLKQRANVDPPLEFMANGRTFLFTWKNSNREFWQTGFIEVDVKNL